MIQGAQKRVALPEVHSIRATALILVLLSVIALLPRVLNLADFLTTDEVYNWMGRVERFSNAIANRRWDATVLVGHPGISLTWLASLGLAAERFASAHGWADVNTQVEYLRWMRLPPAILEASAVPCAYLLLRRLIAPNTALIAALLWATSPYLIAHSRLLHLDALLTTFVTFSLLCVLIALQSARRWRWIVAAGVCIGLALLTKGPALIALPFIGLLMFAFVPGSPINADTTQPQRFIGAFFARLRVAVPLYLLWLAVAVLTFTLVWPAMWVDPGHALRAYFGLILQNGGRPNGDGQFFLGQAIGDPGPLFYIVCDLFRMTPVMLFGLLGIIISGVGRLLPRQSHTTARIATPLAQRQTLWALTVFTLFWTLVMTLGLKKFDRYTLPTWPALLALAAAGWHFWLWDVGAWRGARWSPITPRLWSMLRAVVVVGAFIMEIGTLVQYQPYYLSYYNPILGGGAAAQQTLLIGWGEGMDQVGAYLSSRPDILNGPVMSALPRTLRPFVPVPVKDVIDKQTTPVNYAVVYLESLQRGANPDIYNAIRQTVPLHTITIHGIDYAQIYQLPRPFAHAIDAHFNKTLVLRGVTITHEGNQLVVTPAWDVRGTIGTDYLAFVHVIDTVGRTVAQIDVTPGGNTNTSAWEAGQQIAVPLPLALPRGLPHGSYQITFGLYDAQNGQRIAFNGGVAADPAVAGPNAVLLDTVELP